MSLTDYELKKSRFKTGDIADILGVTSAYVWQQWKEGKLHASTVIRTGRRTVIRFSLEDVLDYNPDAAKRLDPRVA